MLCGLGPLAKTKTLSLTCVQDPTPWDPYFNIAPWTPTGAVPGISSCPYGSHILLEPAIPAYTPRPQDPSAAGKWPDNKIQLISWEKQPNAEALTQNRGGNEELAFARGAPALCICLMTGQHSAKWS